MNSDFVIFIGKYTMETALILTAPILITCIIVGVFVTLLQAVTSIRDMTLTIVPKLISVGIITLIFGNWMIQTLLKFSQEIFQYIQNIGQ